MKQGDRKIPEQGKPNGTRNQKIRRRQPRKDSNSKRVNFDNERVSKFERDAAKKGECNDVSWYAANADLLRSAASIPFSSVTGLKVNTLNWGVPGVMALNWMPHFDSTVITAAANQVYSFVVHANSRNGSYDAPDQMMMIVAGASVFSAIANAIRAYGVARTYSQVNRYTPDGLLRAMGFQPADIRTNLSDMWFDINNLVAQASQIWIPKTMPFIERWFWLSSNIYRDGGNIKDQYYVFAPAALYQLSETGSTQGTSLQPVSVVTSAGMTWSSYCTMVQGMIDSLVSSQDRGIIFGDILKAYGLESLYSISSIPADYIVEPHYNVEVLSQIENATTINVGIGNVTQTNGIIKQEGWSTSTASAATNVHPLNWSILNSHELSAPTPEQTMVMTRLTSLQVDAVMSSDGNSVTLTPAVAGTEFISSVYVYYWDFTSTPGLTRFNYSSWLSAQTTNVPINIVWAELAFDWSPWTYVTPTTTFTATASGIGQNPTVAAGDYSNFTTIDPVTLQKMHLTAAYSEFGVPAI